MVWFAFKITNKLKLRAMLNDLENRITELRNKIHSDKLNVNNIDSELFDFIEIIHEMTEYVNL